MHSPGRLQRSATGSCVFLSTTDVTSVLVRSCIHLCHHLLTQLSNAGSRGALQAHDGM